jgi:hypothetical protein
VGGAALTGFAIGGPWGAAAGAIVGGIAALFGWLFGSDKVTKQREQLETQLEQQLKTLQNSYDLHQTDYSSAISSAEQLRTQFEQAQDQIKKGADMQEYVGQFVDATEKHINSVEAVRQQETLNISKLPLPEFESGGFTPGYLSEGAMVALLHPQEAVLNSTGRAKIGDQAIAAANKGEAPSAGNVTHIHPGAIVIHAADGTDNAALASLIIQRLQQKLGDSGRRLGGR